MTDIQTLLTAIIVSGAFFYVGYRIFRIFVHGDKSGSCCSGCSGCNTTAARPSKK